MSNAWDSRPMAMVVVLACAALSACSGDDTGQAVAAIVGSAVGDHGARMDGGIRTRENESEHRHAPSACTTSDTNGVQTVHVSLRDGPNTLTYD